MDKKYSLENLNGDTYNDEKSCNFLTDSNCLGRHDRKTRSEDEEKSAVSMNGKNSSANEGKDFAEPEPDDDIPEQNR